MDNNLPLAENFNLINCPTLQNLLSLFHHSLFSLLAPFIQSYVSIQTNAISLFTYTNSQSIDSNTLRSIFPTAFVLILLLIHYTPLQIANCIPISLHLFLSLHTQIIHSALFSLPLLLHVIT